MVGRQTQSPPVTQSNLGRGGRVHLPGVLSFGTRQRRDIRPALTNNAPLVHRLTKRVSILAGRFDENAVPELAGGYW